MRVAALREFEYLRPEVVLDFLSTLASSESASDLVVDLVHTLGNTKSDAATHSDALVREATIMALVEIGSPAAGAVVLNLLDFKK
ncbi:MAG: hypothetical protein M2R46_01695 [Verrucomicrobia subdivision 3 bacterium]|nr:hypothetical protein [Limisphaerales bacterium]